MANTLHHGARDTFENAQNRSERRQASERLNRRQSARYAARAYSAGIGAQSSSDLSDWEV